MKIFFNLILQFLTKELKRNSFIFLHFESSHIKSLFNLYFGFEPPPTKQKIFESLNS